MRRRGTTAGRSGMIACCVSLMCLFSFGGDKRERGRATGRSPCSSKVKNNCMGSEGLTHRGGRRRRETERIREERVRDEWLCRGQICRCSPGIGEEERAGRGSIPRLFIKDRSWSGISARTSLASRAMLRTWLPDLSM